MKSTVTPMAGWYVVHSRVAWSGGYITDGVPDRDDFDIEEQRYEVLALESGLNIYRLIITGGDYPSLKIFTTDDLVTDVSREDTSIERVYGPWHDELRLPAYRGHIESDIARVDEWVRADSIARVLLERLLLHGPATEAELLEHPTGYSGDENPQRRREALKFLRDDPAVSWCAGVLSIREEKREELLATISLSPEASTNGAAE